MIRRGIPAAATLQPPGWPQRLLIALILPLLLGFGLFLGALALGVAAALALLGYARLLWLRRRLHRRRPPAGGADTPRSRGRVIEGDYRVLEGRTAGRGSGYARR